MKGTIIREFNERERAAMEKVINMEKQIAAESDLLGCFGIGLILMGISAFIILKERGSNDPSLFLIIFAGFIFLISIVMLLGGIGKLRGRSGWKGKRLETLEDNRVEVLRINATAVVTVGDEAHAHDDDLYYFDIGNQQVLCLRVRQFAVFEKHENVLFVPDQSIWPNDCFDVVRTVKHKLWVGVFCHGEMLKPIRDLSFFDGDPHRQGSEEAGTLLELSPASPVTKFEGSLGNLEETLKKEPIEVWE